MGALFSKPKPPKVSVPTAADETPPPPPPGVPPALPPPAKEAPAVQGAEAAVRRTERRRGRVQTILTSPMGVTGPGKATLGVMVLLALLVPVALWAAAPEEMLTVTSGAVVSPSTPLCRGGTTTNPTQSRALVVILDNNVYYTLGGTTPSSTFGGLALPNTAMYVDHATDIKLIAVGATSRAYVVCIP